MDVVKTNVEKIGGTVDLQSTLGQGTTVRVKIPLTLAIIPALIVTCGGDRYAIPQVSLLELVRLEGNKAVTGIELVHGVPVHRLRGRFCLLCICAASCASAMPIRRVRTRMTRSTSSCCRLTGASSGWSWTQSTTRKKSS